VVAVVLEDEGRRTVPLDDLPVGTRFCVNSTIDADRQDGAKQDTTAQAGVRQSHAHLI